MSSPVDNENPQQLPETTEQQNVQQQDEALDSLGIIVGEITHDFNNILSLIFGYVEMALSELPEGQRARSDLEHVLAAGDRAKELVARILTYSKSTKLKRSEIVIEKPINHALDFITSRLPNNVVLNSTIKESHGNMVLSNEAEIYQVITNLCTNSLQSMENEGGEINVSLDYFDGRSDYAQQHSGLGEGFFARITVEDTGCGMDIATIEKIYNPFFTTARGDEESDKRAGLGLTTVYNIVTSQNGVIFVDSELGKGTKFEICLPMKMSPLNAENYSLDPQDGLKSRHILFIDDEAPIIEMASQMLKQHNYTVSSFTDGNEAIEAFRQQPHAYDLVITDLIMPAITGTELSQKLSSINPNIPIILTTGFSEKITAATCEQWGISTVINKPFTMHDLLQTIEALS